MVVDCDIVSTSRQHLEKFISELRRLATYVKTLYSSLYPSIILENNLAPNTQIGKIIIEDTENPERRFSLCEHQDMYSSDEEVAKYSRGGEFLENYMSGNPLEFARRWLGLGDIYQVVDDIREFYKYNGYRGRNIDYSFKDAIYFTDKNKGIEVISFGDSYMMSPVVTFQNHLDEDTMKSLKANIEKEAMM